MRYFIPYFHFIISTIHFPFCQSRCFDVNLQGLNLQELNDCLLFVLQGPTWVAQLLLMAAHLPVPVGLVLPTVALDTQGLV